MTTGEIALLLQARGFRFSKTLGQNFLMDESMLSSIASGAQIEDQCVLEIGAGAGCLTQELAKRAKKVLAVEIASQLIPVLETVLTPHKNVRVLQADALKLDIAKTCMEEFGEPFHVCANLPYGITTQMLLTLFRIEQLKTICVLLQKEAVERAMSAPGGKEYGPLSILREYLFESDVPLRVPPHCFLPEPHVDSAVLRLRRRENSDMQKYAQLEKLLHACFAMRRKTLLNNLGAAYSKERALFAIERAGLQANVRAEALALPDFLKLMENL